MSIVDIVSVAWVAGNVFACGLSGAYEAIWRDKKSRVWKVGESVWYSLGLPWIALASYLVWRIVVDRIQPIRYNSY